ncbi:maltotransferase domain-containing protein, partial [Corynebacterium striatum]
MTTRLAIDDVRPSLSGSVPSKAVVDEVIPVTALVWREGHDAVAATLSVWNSDSPAVSSVTMDFDSVNPDRVHGVFTPATPGRWFFRVDAWSDPMATWRNAITKKMEAGQSAQELSNDLLHGTELFERASLQSPTDKAALLIDAARALSDESLDPTERVQLALSEETTKLLHTHPLRDLLVEGEIHEVLVERREALFNSWYELFPRSTGGWD